MLTRRLRPASVAQTKGYIQQQGGAGDIGLSRNTYNLGLDSQSIELLVITPGGTRIIGDKTDPFFCKKTNDQIEWVRKVQAKGT